MTSEIIDKLKAIDLQNTDANEIKHLLEQLGNIMMLGIVIPPGDFIIRGVPDSNYDTGRYYENKISYISDPAIVPRENRASIEGRSIFYGSTTKIDESFCQTICVSECASILNHPKDNGIEYEEYVTMGKWRVIKPITLVALAYKKDFHNVNEELANMHKSFLQFCKEQPGKEDEILLVAEYFAEEFSKQVGDNERYKYKISNLFSEILYERGAQGIIYPSVKGEGRGFNVALTPKTVDNSMKLEKVCVWRVLKRNDQCLIDPYLYCDTFCEDGKFKYIAIEPTPRVVVEKKLSGK
jgi:hypothetical protein